MGNKSLFYLTVIILACMGILLIVNFAAIVSPSLNKQFISLNDVDGIAVYHQGTPYTLNFEQQNDLLEYLNAAQKIEKGKIPPLEPSNNFDKIIIYPFNAPEIILTPIGYDRQNLIYEIKNWNPKGYFKDATDGKLRTLISNTYDP